jgi:hypothetical protein
MKPNNIKINAGKTCDDMTSGIELRPSGAVFYFCIDFLYKFVVIFSK